jgi:hypothetical protein
MRKAVASTALQAASRIARVAVLREEKLVEQLIHLQQAAAFQPQAVGVGL